MSVNIITIYDAIAWSYANLTMAHVALQDNRKTYGPKYYAIRNKSFNGLKSGEMKIRSLVEDERIKMKNAQECNYCGKNYQLTLDHLIPASCGGPNRPENIIWACKSCNSSKGSKDLLNWMKSKNKFPSLMVLRRYLKLAIEICDERGILESSFDKNEEYELPFDLNNFPIKFPSLENMIIA